MSEILRGFVTPVVLGFVVSTMLHVGATQPPTRILRYLENWPFVLKMIVANFVAAPLLMYLVLRFTSFDSAIDAGLIVFSLCAGAPFLIELTRRADHDLALGAFTMMLLMVLTVAVAPIVLPFLLEGVRVDSWAVARALLLQMLLPIGVGMLASQLAPSATRRVEPVLAKVSRGAMYAVIVVTLLAYWPSARAIFGTGAILAALGFVAGAFGIGYLAGWGADHLEDIGALGTAQRNTGAGFVIATQNFDDPDVLVIMTIASTFGMVLLLLVAGLLTRDNAPRIVNV